MTNAERAFQLTPSRRATERGVRPRATLEFQLTPSRRATLLRHPVRRIHNISTHALTEGDSDCMAAIYGLAISTHALTEGDTVCLFQILYLCYFNSRPHGGRLKALESMGMISRFQLTPSRRATSALAIYETWGYISTHALTEGDQGYRENQQSMDYFNSRPHGGRPSLSWITEAW